MAEIDEFFLPENTFPSSLSFCTHSAVHLQRKHVEFLLFSPPPPCKLLHRALGRRVRVHAQANDFSQL